MNAADITQGIRSRIDNFYTIPAHRVSLICSDDHDKQTNTSNATTASKALLPPVADDASFLIFIYVMFIASWRI